MTKPDKYYLGTGVLHLNVGTNEDKNKPSIPDPLVVVRVRTSWYHDNKGMHMKKSLTLMKRKSQGHNWVWEDLSNIGAEEVMPRIDNLMEVEDGLYEIEMINASRDYETGYLDDWDYKLIKYHERGHEGE